MKTNEGGAAFGAIGKERSKLLAMIMVMALMVVGVSIVASNGGDDVDAVVYEMPEPVDGVITLTELVALQTGYTVPEDVEEIDLNGQKITSTLEGYAITIPSGSDVLIRNGTINAVGGGILAYGDLTLGSDLKITITGAKVNAVKALGSELTVDGAEIDNRFGFGIVIGNSDEDNTIDSIPSKLVFNSGSVECCYFAVSTNNLYSAGCTIDINGGTFESTDSDCPAIYLPAMCEVTIDNATITGASGIEMKMGDLTIGSGTIINATGEYKQDYVPLGGGAGANGSAINIAAHQYGSVEGQAIDETNLHVTIQDGAVLNSTNANGVDIFNMGLNDTDVLDVNIDIETDVGSVRIVNNSSIESVYEVPVTIADTSVVGTLIFIGNADVTVNGTVDEISGSMIGSLIIGAGSSVGFGSDYVNEGSIGVSDANGLKAALVAGGVIEVNDDIETSEATPFYITSNTTINGNGHSVTTTSAEKDSRVFSIVGENSNPDYVIPSDSIVTINNLEVVGPTVVNYTRGITVHDTTGLVLNINGGSVSAGAYAINIGGGNSGLTLNVTGTTISGWCAFQTHSMVTKANFTDCVLIGTNTQENPASNGFSTIVINDEAANASEASGDLLFDGCTIVAKMTTQATQMAINIRSMENSTITLRNSEIDLSETTAPMIYMAATNSVTIDGILNVEGTATIFSEDPEDGGTVTGGTINLDENDILILNNGTSYTGRITGPDGTAMDLDLVAGEGGVTISVGSFIIDGAGSGTLTFSDGVEVEGSNEGMDFVFEGGVTFNNFTEIETGSLTFKDAEGNEYTDVSEAIEAGVDIRLGSNTSLSDLPFSTVDMNLEFTYDGTAHSPATGIPFAANQGYTISSVYISGGNCVSGDVPSMVVVAQINVGTYTIQYTLVITDAQGQSTTYSPTIEWSILPQDVEITHEDISKEYDGTSDVEQSFTAVADGLALGNAYYTDINAGEGKEVRLPIVIAEGSVAENYTFTVNGVEAELMGDAEAGYYIVLQGTITQKEITVDITAKQEYDGYVFKHPYSGSTGIEGDILTVTVTTTGSDAKTYSGADLEYGGYIVMNGETYVSTNYVVNYNPSNTLTIDPRDIIISPATGAVITKEYNGWSSRIMSESDFQMSGAIDGDDVSFGWTPGASNIWYNSSNVLEANTLTVNGLFLEGEDSSNYELPNTTVVFVDGENGLTVGITPMVLTISNGSGISIEKTYDNRNTVPSGQIDTNDYSVSAAQNGTYPDININAAVFGSVDAGTDLTVYVTDATLVDGDNGVASNFALPEMQTYGDIQYYFSITGANVKINPITVDGNMVKGTLSEQDGQIILTVTVKSEDLEDLEDLELTNFGSTLKFGEATIDAIEGTNSYIIDKSGRYTATVTSNDDNWIASNVAAPIDVDFDYTANFFTQTTLNGEYILELTVSFENGMVHTPAATNVPEGYELVGWRTADGIEYGVGEYAPVSAIGTDFYAVYEEIGGSTPEPTGPTITIDIPDEFPIGTEIEFTVSTTAGNYTGGNVQGTGIFEGIPGVDYNIWYWEVQDDSWHEWISGNFGPEGGFPLIDATSKFKIQFINAGTYDLTVQIVTVSDNGVVCETSAVVDVPAENSLGYHVLDALDYVYADGGEYNADAYSYIAEFDADADSIIATYGHEYFEALIAYITNTETDEQTDMAEDVMNDFARYMGALYRSSDGDVGRVYFNGTEYVWKAATDGKWLNGCNWRDENGVTLTSAVVDYIESTQSTGIIMEIAVPGGDRQVLTYSAVFEDAPTPDIQYYNVTLAASEGVQFYVLDGSIVVAGTYSVAEGAHTISAVAADGWQFTGGVPAFNGAENGQFEVVDQDVTISVSNVEIVEESLEYTVNFSYRLVDGTTIETDQPKSMTVYFLRDQVPTVVLPVPTIDGYTFVGWYGSDGEYFSGGGQVVLTSMETSLTARFIQMATYTVVFSGEGGQTYSNVAIGDAVVAPEVEVAEGYMVYWATENGFMVDLGERYYLSSMDVGENNTVTFILVTEEIPEDPTYTITIPTGTGYTSMSETISGIVSGQDRTFTINPTAGYAIRAVNATYDEGGDVTINSYQNGESWIVTIYGITGDVTVKVTVEQKDVVDGVFVEADYAPNGASVTLSPVSSGDDGILPNGTITVFYTYRTTVTIDGVQYEGNTTGSFTAVEYTNDDGSSIDHVSVTGDYPESTIRGYAVFTDEEGNSYYSTFFTVNVLSEAGE